jgi:hypothetical protein
MAADTMEDVVGEDGGLEPTDDEARLLRTLRDNKLSAEQVADRIENAMNRPPSAPTPASSAPPKQMVSADEVRTMFTEYDQKAKQTARAREVQKEIKGAIGKIVDESGLTKRSRRRDRVVDDVFGTLSVREDIAKLTDEDFQKVLLDEANKAIAEEREDDVSSSSAPTTPSTNEGRKTAAETMGQTNGNEPPPKSAAQTEELPRGNRVNAGNVDEAFGAAERNWNLSDGEIEQDTDRKAEKHLRKARGG